MARRGTLHEPVDDLGQLPGAAGADHELHEVGGDRRRLGAEEVLDDALATGRRDRLVGQRRPQVVVALERAGEPEQLVLDLAEAALDAGDLEERVGVAVDARIACGAHYFVPTVAM